MRRRNISLYGCLTGSTATKRLWNLIRGERGSRDYMLERPGTAVYGYFYDDASGFWIAFDNRGGCCWIDHFKHEIEAMEALSDGDDFFAA